MTPLVRAVVGFAAGVVIGLRLDLGHGALVVTWGALGVSSALLVRRGSQSVHLCAVLFAALGVLAGATAALGVRADCRTALPDGATIGVRGTLEGAPAAGGTAWFRLESLRVRGRETACSGALRVRLPARGSPPPVGAVLTGSGVWWAYPRSTSWPEPPERGGTLGLRSLRVAEDGGLASVLPSARGRAQERVRALFPRQSGLAEALVLAERGGIDAEVKQDFTTVRGKPRIRSFFVDCAVYSRIISVRSAWLRLG